MSLLDLISKVAESAKAKCSFCTKEYDKKIRFVKLMESDETDYRKILEQHEYCSDECMKKEWIDSWLGLKGTK